MNQRSSHLVSACIGKTIKLVTDIPSDLRPINDDTDGFILEFTDGTRLEVSAMSDKSVGVVGVKVETPK